MNRGENFEIRPQQALNEIYNNDGEFSMEFIGVGKGRGRIRKERVRFTLPVSKGKAVKEAKANGLEAPESPKRSWNHNINKSHNLLLFDIEKNSPFEIKIWALMQYNNLNILWHVAKK
jgi:hypothetical protein